MTIERKELLFPTAGDAHRYCKQHGLDLSMADEKIWDIALALYDASHPQSDLPAISFQKASKIGEICGYLARNEDGRIAAVSELGRVTWLKQSVE